MRRKFPMGDVMLFFLIILGGMIFQQKDWHIVKVTSDGTGLNVNVGVLIGLIIIGVSLVFSAMMAKRK